jgi:membrane-associated phospholipid phosphatase
VSHPQEDTGASATEIARRPVPDGVHGAAAGRWRPASAWLPPLPRLPAAIVSAACGLAFAIVAVWVSRSGHAVPAVDRELHEWALGHRSHWSISIARVVRWGGITDLVLPVLFVIGTAAAKVGSALRRLQSGLFLVAIAGAGIAVETEINALIGRGRPPVADWAGAAGGPSFPSGHTTAATIFAVSCAWILMGRVRAVWRRRAIWAGAALYAGIVGWSRIWLGVHWPTDVLGACLFSLAWMSGAIALLPAPRLMPPPLPDQRGVTGPVA